MIKLKHFSKFMRNSLVLRYQKVKSYCAIKSYARNVIICDKYKLKQRSFNGLRMMLMRLRDKENRMKTEQELIVKVDRVMYKSRKTSKLTETIHRFNSSMRKEGVLRWEERRRKGTDFIVVRFLFLFLLIWIKVRCTFGI